MITRFRLLALAATAAAALAIPAIASAQAPRTASVTLAPQSGSGVAGTATLTDMGGGKTQVVVRVSVGSGGSAAMPAHVHTGNCPNVGAVVYPLDTITNGTSTSTINTALADIQTGGFAVNLHRSAADINTYVSCGNIAVAGATALPRTGGASLPIFVAAGAVMAGLAGFALRRRAR